MNLTREYETIDYPLDTREKNLSGESGNHAGKIADITRERSTHAPVKVIWYMRSQLLFPGCGITLLLIRRFLDRGLFVPSERPLCFF